MRAERPAPTDPRLVALVIVGGAVGTTVRHLLEVAFPHVRSAWPSATFGINLVGSFLLAVLLTWLIAQGPDSGWRRGVRVGVGTGVLGGFTTYSTFIIEADSLLRDGHVVLGLAYATGSVILGIAAALAGAVLVRTILTPRAAR
jgi:CrcB protein